MKDSELSTEKKQHFARIRRVKKLLRYLPRKATVHRYPFIKFFANTARKRHYLWSFRSKEVVPALYAGFILTFLPLQGVQIPIALGLALVFRANLMILVALQFVSNVFTIVPIYAMDYYIGHFVFSLFGSEPEASLQEMQAYSAEEGIKEAFRNYDFGQMFEIGKKIVRVFKDMMLGGAIVGYFCGFISSLFYRVLTRKVTKARKPE